MVTVSVSAPREEGFLAQCQTANDEVKMIQSEIQDLQDELVNE